MLKKVLMTGMTASEDKIEGKEKVLRYMKNGKNPVCAAMYYKDRENGVTPFEAIYWDDGVYTWSSDTLYHFEKYNYRIEQEFVDYVLKKKDA